MFEIKLKLLEHLREKSDVKLTWVHFKFEGDHLGLNEVGEGLTGNLFLPNRCWREDAIVVCAA